MPPPPGHDPRYESLDAWRGVACLMVVLHHAGFALRWDEATGDRARLCASWLFRQMDLGVPLFFVISGYCIAASLDAHRRRGASSWAFLGRRLWRIYPPYWASVLLFVVTSWALDRAGLHVLHDGGHSLELDSPGDLNWAQWLGNLTLTETWRSRAWGGGPPQIFTRVAWSLCFEEQFYLVVFLTLLVAPRRLFGALGVLSVAIVGFRVVAADVGWIHRYEGSFPILWHEFAIGLAVYWRLVWAPDRRARWAVDAALVGLLAAGLALSFRSTSVSAAFGLALIALRDAGGSGPGWLRACGRRCYSIYLVHLPACTVGSEWLYTLGLVGFWPRVLVMIPLVSLAAVGVGWAFFGTVETHFLNPPADRRPHPRPVAGEEAGSPAGQAAPGLN